jgi:benzoate 4-monooxygenase
MLPAGADIAEVRTTPTSPPTYAPAIQVLNRRGEVCSTLGCLPSLTAWAPYLPDSFFRNGLRAVTDLAGIAVARVNERLAHPARAAGRVDLLARLMEGRDEAGERLCREELTAEALTQLIAGSDTTSNTSCALLFWVLKTKGVAGRLAAELDAAVPAGGVPRWAQVRDLPLWVFFLSRGFAIADFLRRR